MNLVASVRDYITRTLNVSKVISNTLLDSKENYVHVKYKFPNYDKTLKTITAYLKINEN